MIYFWAISATHNNFATALLSHYLFHHLQFLRVLTTILIILDCCWQIQMLGGDVEDFGHGARVSIAFLSSSKVVRILLRRMISLVWLLPELSARLIPFISLWGVDRLLFYMAHDDSLHLRPRLTIFCHQPRALVSKLATHIWLRVPSIEFSRVRRSMHHEVPLRTSLVVLTGRTAEPHTRRICTIVIALSAPTGYWDSDAVTVVHVSLSHDVDDHRRVLGKKCFVIDLFPLVEFAHLLKWARGLGSCDSRGWGSFNRIGYILLRLSSRVRYYVLVGSEYFCLTCFRMGDNGLNDNRLTVRADVRISLYLDSREAKVLQMEPSDEVKCSIW